MPVDAVVGDIQLAPYKPLVLRVGEVHLAHLVPLLKPIELLSPLAPELIRVSNRAVIQLLVLLHALDNSCFAKLLRGWEHPLLVHHGQHSFVHCHR